MCELSTWKTGTQLQEFRALTQDVQQINRTESRRYNKRTRSRTVTLSCCSICYYNGIYCKQAQINNESSESNLLVKTFLN